MNDRLQMRNNHKDIIVVSLLQYYIYFLKVRKMHENSNFFITVLQNCEIHINRCDICNNYYLGPLPRAY